MWRLTAEAIRDGVKSTTRYRSKQPNKRGHRSHRPLPQRQASGAKGGQAARRAKQIRQGTHTSDPYRSEPYRSVPASYDAFSTDMPPMPSYAPYYVPSTEPTLEEYPKDNFSSTPIRTPNIDLLNQTSYVGSPPLSDQTVGYGESSSAYNELSMLPTEPLFTNSPSPPADEPRTPDSPSAGWPNEVALRGTGSDYIFDMGFSDFPV